jgi:hypothetical protein
MLSFIRLDGTTACMTIEGATHDKAILPRSPNPWQRFEVYRLPKWLCRDSCFSRLPNLG